MTNYNNEADQDLLDRINKMKSASEDQISQYHDRWSKNIKLLKGIFDETESSRSKVRKRSKIFFRKIWASRWRILASLYNAFMRDLDAFKIEGRDVVDDPRKAQVLQKMTEYRRDVMNRTQQLFLKIIWGFMNILDMGWCVGKFQWVYDEERGKDYPEFTLYPNEQVFPDLTADVKSDMEHIIFVNYKPYSYLEQNDFDNLDAVQQESVPGNTVRNARMHGRPDPLQNPQEDEYPSPGTYSGDDRKMLSNEIYAVWEIFYQEDGKTMYCITNGYHCVLKQPEESVYEDYRNIVMGSCLTEANQLIGEGFPEPLEGPQESLNMNMNQRKDNISLILNRETIVSRYGNVDLKSLANSRPGGITLADDVNAVKDRDVQDVTRSSYLEAQSDDMMMNEMSGVMPGHDGGGKEEKTGVAQINYSERNAKIDLYTAIIGETFVKDFYSGLAYIIQKFETDEMVFRIANETLELDPPVYNVEFEADIIINAGMGTTGRELEINQLLMAMDRSIMSNQSAIALMQTGMVPEGWNIAMVDTTQFIREILPKIGKKDFERYFFTFEANNPMGWPGQKGTQNAAIAGGMQPQIGGGGFPTMGGGDAAV